MKNKKYLIFTTLLLFLFLIPVFYYGNKSNINNGVILEANNVEKRCRNKLTQLGNVKIDYDCNKYYFYNDNLKIEGLLESYDENNVYTLVLAVNGKMLNTDFFTNKTKKAIFGNLFVDEYNNYIVVTSSNGAQWNDKNIAIFNKEGILLFEFENGNIYLTNSTLTIEKDSESSSGVDSSCICKDGKETDTYILSTKYIYKLENNDVKLDSKTDTTCANICVE